MTERSDRKRWHLWVNRVVIAILCSHQSVFGQGLNPVTRSGESTASQAIESDQEMRSDPFLQDALKWRRTSNETLRSPDGWLALIAHLWIGSEGIRLGNAENASFHLGTEQSSPFSVEFLPTALGVEVRASDASVLTVNEQSTSNKFFPFSALGEDANSPDKMVLLQRYSLQIVRRNNRLAVRVRDSQSEALRSFAGKQWFDVDAKWQIKATYTPFESKRALDGTNSRGEASAISYEGTVEFEYGNQTYRWLAMNEDDKELMLAFRDSTSGNQTYPSGRFLNFKRPQPQDDHGQPRSVLLDFNRAYNPPCSVTPHSICPLPPAQNQVDFGIEAGERYRPRSIRLKKMMEVMGRLPSRTDSPLDLQEISRESMDGYDRVKLTFSSGDPLGGTEVDRVPAWLLIPHAIASPRPAMLCLHQTIAIGKDEPVGLGEQESKRQALHLVRRGYVCLAPDYPSFGEYAFDFQRAFSEGMYQSGTMKAIWNNMRAVDLLCSLPEVDCSRIGVIGHSLGGHNALFTAAFDTRLQVAVTSCGFCSFSKYYGGQLKGWTSDRYMPRIATEFRSDPSQMPFDFDDVLLSIYPRSIFVMAPERDANFDVKGVREVIEKVLPAYEQGDRLKHLEWVHPDAAHEWPEPQREQAYQFIDQVLSP